MQNGGRTRKANGNRSVPRLYFTLPIPREVVQAIMESRAFRMAFSLLRNDAFAALSTLIHVGIERTFSTKPAYTTPEFVDLFASKSRDCRENPERFRTDQLDKAQALTDYLARGLQVA